MRAWAAPLRVSIATLVVAIGAAQTRQSPVPFIDITAESGLDFIHVNGTAGELLLPEVMGAGGALFDYDNDGDLDLYVVQGAALKPAQPNTTPRASPTGDRLYRNDVQVRPDGARTVRFVDVTDASGIVETGYGMGAATGDFNSDGWVDLYVTNLGSNQMWRNNGDLTFTDVTAATGTDDPRWSASATFFDYDRDGWLDLFVTNYVRFTVDMRRACFSKAGARDYCNPEVYDAAPDRLFHNNGDGTFSDVSVRAGIVSAFGKGLGVVTADLNADGWIDLYVANDGDANHLWINGGRSGRFTDQGLLAGVALNGAGQSEGSMGVDAADFDADGDEDLFVTNLDNETNTLYVNIGKGLFEDRTIAAGLFQPSLGFTGFGTRFFDYDNDGWLDLLVVNGAVRHLESLIRQGHPYPLGQRDQLYRNENGKRFVEVTRRAGRAFELLDVGRGAAFGDLDNDGDTDVVVFNNKGPARVLLNAVGSRRHWLGARVIATGSRRDAFNARVELVQPGSRSLWRRVQTDGSYCSSSDPRVLFGLADDPRPRTIRVHWPGGGTEEYRDLKVDRYWVLEQGETARTID